MSLIRPEPLPDELANGYAGRIRQHNGWIDEKCTMRELLRWSGRHGQTLRDVPPVELLAKAAGMNLHSFVHEHSMLPLRRAITSNSPGELLGGARQTTALWSLAMRPMRPHAYLCPRCIAEDVGFHGESYWRREHQIPGRYRCVRHECALSYVSLPKAYLAGPAACLGAVHQAPQGVHEQSQSSNAIERYLDICSCLLHVDTPRDELAVSRVAKARVKALNLGFHVGKGAVTKALLSDRLRLNFDGAWLESVIPGLMNVPRGKFWSPVDRVLLNNRSGMSVIAYALVFAVLYDCADDAANAIISAELLSTKGRPNLKMGRLPSYEQLRVGYILAQINRNRWRKLDRMETDRLERVVQTLLLDYNPLGEASRKNKMSYAEVRGALLAAINPIRNAPTEINSIRAVRNPGHPLVKDLVRERLD
ncbi:TniQ family protein [Hydrogenophaga sp. ZJX-1]|uniref:TniQ family protein n=1 Tax=Hydrogenophaga sp. ZJX-1 TaxID=3404778 RepID=UPI003B2860DE